MEHSDRTSASLIHSRPSNMLAAVGTRLRGDEDAALRAAESDLVGTYIHPSKEAGREEAGKGLRAVLSRILNGPQQADQLAAGWENALDTRAAEKEAARTAGGTKRKR